MYKEIQYHTVVWFCLTLFYHWKSNSQYQECSQPLVSIALEDIIICALSGFWGMELATLAISRPELP